MPKPFMLGIEVEEIALGKVMRSLNKMPGVVKLHMDLTPKPNGVRGPYKKRVPRGEFGETGSEALVKLMTNGPLPVSEMKAAFIAQGRSVNSVNSQLSKLKDEGAVENKGGKWGLTAKMKDRLRHRKEKH